MLRREISQVLQASLNSFRVGPEAVLISVYRWRSLALQPLVKGRNPFGGKKCGLVFWRLGNEQIVQFRLIFLVVNIF